MEAAECGAASLAIILEYFGRYEPLENIRHECGVTRDGSTASDILRAAEHYGLKGVGGFLTPQEVFSKSQQHPVIIFWAQSHFLVVEGQHKNKVYLNDPATGSRIVDIDEFIQHFSHLCLTLTPTKDFEKGKTRPAMLRSLMSNIGGIKQTLLLAFLASLLLIIPGIIIPFFSKIFIDNYIIGGQISWVAPLVVTMVITLFVQFVLVHFQQNILIKLQLKLALSSVLKLISHLLHLPMSFFAQRQSGDLISRMQSAESIASLLSSGLTGMVFNLIQVVFYLLVMLLYSWELALIVVFFGILHLSLYKYSKYYRQSIIIRLKQHQGKMLGITVNGLSGIETLKANASESIFFNNWAGAYTRYINESQSLGFFNQIYNHSSTLLVSTSNVMVLGIGGYLVMQGSLSIGGLVAFQALLLAFNAPLLGLSEFGGAIQEVSAELDRVNDIMNYQIEQKKQVTLTQYLKHHPSKLSGAVTIDNLNFGYDRDSIFIEDFNLSIKPGQRVAIVGHSGSGKSTLAKIIAGLYTPHSGDILFDQLHINSIPSEVFAQSVSYVPQDSFIFNGSFADNITLWDQGYPLSQLTKIAKCACIYDDIATKPGAFAGIIAEGGRNLSGGQRQRIEIARALTNDPSFFNLR